MTKGFLDIDIFFRLACPDRHKAVPVVGRSDRDHIDFFVIENFSNILYALRGIFEFTLDEFLAASNSRESGSTK